MVSLVRSFTNAFICSLPQPLRRSKSQLSIEDDPGWWDMLRTDALLETLLVSDTHSSLKFSKRMISNAFLHIEETGGLTVYSAALSVVGMAI